MVLGRFLYIALSIILIFCECISEESCKNNLFCKEEIITSLEQCDTLDQQYVKNFHLSLPEEVAERKSLNISESQKPSFPSIAEFFPKNFINCEGPDLCTVLLPWDPSDWSDSPSGLKYIVDKNYGMWASILNRYWKQLAHKTSDNLMGSPEMSSLMYLPKGFIVPGGKFQGLYYWDSFWIIKGLLTSNMIETAKGIIENHIFLLNEIGKVPRANNIFHSDKTQPPMLGSMLESYYEVTKDYSFIKENIKYLEKEVQYFFQNKLVTVYKNGEKLSMFRYYYTSNGSSNDLLFEKSQIVIGNENLFRNLRSAIESGWDYSSRWFIAADGSNAGTLTDTKTEYIIPVDLNALMHKNLELLAKWSKDILGNNAQSLFYKHRADALLYSINNVLWHDEGVWLDYDMLNNKSRNYFYLSNFFPLWTESHNFDKKELSMNILSYISITSALRFTGGVPASFQYSGEQWDFPNCWAPLQGFLIEGLEKLGTPQTARVAYTIASTWLKTNFYGLVHDGKMYNKYTALEQGKYGSGGHYPVQIGFGWTNGVALYLLNRYADQLESPSITASEYQMLYDLYHNKTQSL